MIRYGIAVALALALAAIAHAQAPDDGQRQASFARPGATEPLPGEAADGRAEKRAVLGLKLFRDKRLSRDESFACESCHYHGLAFADPRQRAVGFMGDALERNTPALWNLAWATRFGWEGRDIRLEDQVLIPVVHTREMGGTWPEIIARLSRDPALVAAFAETFPEAGAIREETIARALASYVRTIVSPPTRFDRWLAGADSALADDERAGSRLFFGKAECASCHAGWRFADDAVHPTGFADAPALRTPTLRELLWTGPYLHDGSAATLSNAVSRHVAALGKAAGGPAVSLSDAESSALIAFLSTLSSEDAPRPLARP